MPKSRSTLSENVAGVVRQQIFDGDYLSGERLVELGLAQEMGVSQNTVRDALHIIIEDGLAVKLPRRGVYVRRFNAEEAAELCALWAAIEGLALDWALVVMTNDDHKRLSSLLETIRVEADNGTPHSITEAVFDLHRAIVAIAGRQQTADLLYRIHNQARLLEILRQMRAPRSRLQQQTRLDTLALLLEMVAQGDSTRAQDILYTHIMSDCAALLPLLDMATGAPGR